MEDFKLTRKDMAVLRSWGHDRKEYKQIEVCANICIYTDNNEHTMSYKDAIEILGREQFLSGISRAAFHWTSYREDHASGVYFDCRDRDKIDDKLKELKKAKKAA